MLLRFDASSVRCFYGSLSSRKLLLPRFDPCTEPPSPSPSFYVLNCAPLPQRMGTPSSNMFSLYTPSSLRHAVPSATPDSNRPLHRQAPPTCLPPPQRPQTSFATAPGALTLDSNRGTAFLSLASPHPMIAADGSAVATSQNRVRRGVSSCLPGGLFFLVLECLMRLDTCLLVFSLVRCGGFPVFFSSFIFGPGWELLPHYGALVVDPRAVACIGRPPKSTV